MISQSVYPLIAGITVVPSDSTVLTDVRAIYVGGAGDLAVKMIADGSTVTFKGVPAGSILPVQVNTIMATGTTATSILAFR
jgi:hypothetical protein